MIRFASDTKDQGNRRQSRDGRPGQRRMPSSTLQLPPTSSRLHNVSVDSLLANTGEVPSARKRGGISGSAGSKRQAELARQIPKHNMPQRTSKTSQKLVLLPEDDNYEAKTYAVAEEFDESKAPPHDDEIQAEEPDHLSRRSFAERMSKDRRHEKNLPRVTAYCTCEAYRLQRSSRFLRRAHAVKPRIYDECLYAAYHLPLIPGADDTGCRVQSSPQIKNVKGEDLLDQQIDRTETRDHTRDWNKLEPTGSSNGPSSTFSGPKSPEDESSAVITEESEDPERPKNNRRRDSLPTAEDVPQMYKHAELFLFSYGAVVFWNFSESQERDILADLTFAENGTLMSRPLKSDDLETEEFHFEYSPKTHAPRIFNDMITLRSGDHFIKLAMSHALAQSVKLSLFEERMEGNMERAQHIPRKLALTGELGMTRDQVIKMSGRLFKQRVDVNLSSNVLDTPDFFWDSEPSLNPLYSALREYLEIRQRILVLNERCQVVFDLLNILSDSIAESNMNRITWIVIYLIILSVVVTSLEVVIRFVIIQRAQS